MRSAQISFTNKKVWIIGAGRQAMKKGRQFIEEGAMVVFVAPFFDDKFKKEYLTEFAIHTYMCVEKSYEMAKIQDGFLVYACTDQQELNHRIVMDANEMGLLSASVHRDMDASYHSMKSIDYPHMHMAISTNGAYPSYNKDLLEEVEMTFDKVLNEMQKSYEEIHHEKLKALRIARAETTKKQAILVVSYGSTMADTRRRNIEAIEQDVKVVAKEKGIAVYSAFSSKYICKQLAKQGIDIMNVRESMWKMQSDGVTEVTVLVTHLLYGTMYQSLVNEIEAEQRAMRDMGVHACQNIRITDPLLINQAAGAKVLSCIDNEVSNTIISREKEEALVLMGHGTDGYGNMTFASLNYVAREQGYDYMFIGTMEGYPNLEQITIQLKKSGYRKVLLMPFMLVAGKHAHKDMASKLKESWRSRLEASGLEVRVQIQGLGEIQSIRELYLSQL